MEAVSNVKGSVAVAVEKKFVNFNEDVKVIDYCPAVVGIYKETLSGKAIVFNEKRKCRQICSVYQQTTFPSIKLPEEFNLFRQDFEQVKLNYMKDTTKFKQVHLCEKQELFMQIMSYTDSSGANINYHPVFALNTNSQSICLILSSFKGACIVVSYDIAKGTVSFEKIGYAKLKIFLVNENQFLSDMSGKVTKELINNVLAEYRFNPIYKIPGGDYLMKHADASEDEVKSIFDPEKRGRVDTYRNQKVSEANAALPKKVNRKRESSKISNNYIEKSVSSLELPEPFNQLSGYFTEKYLKAFESQVKPQSIDFFENQKFFKKTIDYVDFSEKNLNYKPVFAHNIDSNSVCLILTLSKSGVVVLSYDQTTTVANFKKLPYEKLKLLIYKGESSIIAKKCTLTKEFVGDVLAQHGFNPFKRASTDAFTAEYGGLAKK